MRREHLVIKLMTDIILPMEEELIDTITQKFRNVILSKPNWARGELNDLFIKLIQEVKNERRKSSDTQI